MPGSADQNADRLYQLAPDDFTRERNALAKEVGGDEGKRLRALPKPSVSAWAVNQLYWQDRETYDDLVKASERLRTAHKSVLGGRKADLTGADAAHRDAVKQALTSTLRLAGAAGEKVSPAAHTEIAQTLERLSSEDPAGRLSKPLRPEGFEALQGMTIAGIGQPAIRKVEKVPERDDVREARERKEAQRRLRAAQERVRHEQTEVARLERQLSAAQRRTESARRALDQAEEAEAKLRNALKRAQKSLDESASSVPSTRPGR